MKAATATGPRNGARPLRFLMLLLGGWTVVRVMAHWTVPAPMQPIEIVAAPAEARADFDPLWASVVAASDRRTLPTASAAPMARDASHGVLLPRSAQDFAEAPAKGDALGGLRSAMLARLLPPLPGGEERAAVAGRAWVPAELLPYAGPPGSGQPYWMKRQLAGWSLGGWAYVRAGSGKAPGGGLAAASQLGGSQAGVRIAYGFGDSGRLRAYGRVTIALAQPRQRELALGLAFAPVAHWPVDAAIEQRVALGSQGRTALAATVVGGVSDVPLLGRFRLEAYGQAGVVGTRRREGFADAAVVVDREIARGPEGSVHLGALAAGSVQP
uniref:hypothetical protein n=1 Tax=Sphingopyxis sp. KK2 TaxID=1855727 RepID=UPI00097E5A06